MSVAEIVVGVVIALVVAWGLLVVALLIAARDRVSVSSALRMLPDLLRLVARLAKDPSLPRGVRVRLWLLVAYLALPIDLIPDFVPVVGYADDAVVVLLVLRSAVRRAGPDSVRRHWPGTDDGLAALMSLVGRGAATDGPQERL